MIAQLAPIVLALAPIATWLDDSDGKPEVAGDLPLVFESEFESDGLSGWRFTDPDAWKVGEVDGNHVLEQFKASQYEPKVRSPLNIALIDGLNLADFVLDVRVRSTGRDYGHRDLCFFFGRQDPSHLYYVHLGKQADPHAHSIFLVDDEPRVSIAKERTDGTPWTDDWHHVRLVRQVDSGRITVYFDDMETPIMKAEDKTFEHGLVGLGSFDDTGQFDDLRIWGAKAEPAE